MTDSPSVDYNDRVTLLKQKCRGSFVGEWAAVMTLPARVRVVADARRAAPGEVTHEVKVRDFGPILRRDRFLFEGHTLSVTRVLELDQTAGETLCFCETV